MDKPCHNICLGLARMDDYVGQDAPVASSSTPGPHNPGFQRHEVGALRFERTAPSIAEPPPKRQALAIQDSAPPPPPTGDRNLVRKSVNNKNKPICAGFQTGACCRVNRQSLCAADGVSVHQCEICLKTSHGSSSCPLLNGGAEDNSGKGAGRGRGGGKGAGRGRRRGR